MPCPARPASRHVYMGHMGIQLTNNQAGSAETVSATGQAQLLRGLGLMGEDTTAYLNNTAESAAESQVITVLGRGYGRRRHTAEQRGERTLSHLESRR